MKTRTFTLFRAAVIAALALVACSKEEKEPSGNDQDASGEQTKVATLLDVSPDSVAVTYEGGSQAITVTSDGAWTAVSDKDWCVPEPASGSGDGKVTLTVAAETLGKADTARITVTAGSLKATVVVTRAANPAAVTDCQGHTYPVVKIGEQYWMAENLQCTQYDTESERAGATLSTLEIGTFDPYYTDGRNATYNKLDAPPYNGSAATGLRRLIDGSCNLTPELRAKLGLLYNWAAAMGYASQEEATTQVGDYEGNRQGICPNGWHLPSQAELTALNDYVAGQDATVGVGAQLKATSGWYSDSSDGNGTDAYGFAALPAGTAYGSDVMEIGVHIRFWSSDSSESGYARTWYMEYYDDALGYSQRYKVRGNSVRCVRNQ